MEYFDAMELASPFDSNPCTPKPKSRNFRTPSPPPYKSNATVVSLDSSPVRNNNNNGYDIEDHMHDFLSRQQQQWNYNDNGSDATQIPNLTEHSRPHNSPVRNSYAADVTPLALVRPRTFERHELGDGSTISQTLDHMTLSPTTANPPITVLLVLTPQPASLAETTAFEAFGSRFCSDFGAGGAGLNWTSVSLYAHFRRYRYAGAQQKIYDQTPLGGRSRGDVGGNDVSIGAIHPYALRARLDQGKEVQWRLAVPVLKALIDSEVKKGSRAFVVCGLAVGDLDGVRAFGRVVSR
jgi:hypothetical protein